MATEISKLAVVLTANGAALAGGLKTSERAMDSLKAKAEGLGGSLSGLTGVLAGVGLAFGATEAYTIFRTQKEAVAQLDAALKSTGGSAGLTSRELQGLAADLQKVTNYGDEATIAAESLLLGFESIKGANFKAAVVEVQNLAARMKMDLPGAARLVGRALEDPERGLERLNRVGVVFTEQQKDQIKAMQEAGDLAGAQVVILDALERKYGGAAAAAVDPFVQAKNAIGDAVEVIVGSLEPALTTAANLLREGAQWASAHAEAIGTLARIVLTVVTAVLAYKVAMFALTVAQQAWAAGQAIVLSLQGPGGWAQLAVAAGAATVGVLAVNAAFDKVKDAAAGANKYLADAHAQLDAAKAKGAGAAGGLKLTAKQAEELGKKVREATDRLKEQVATFGLSSHEAEIYKLQMKGATDAQLAEARALAAKLDLMEEEKKLREKMAEAAKKYIDQSKDPFEKAQEELSEINRLEKEGLLTDEQAIAAGRKALDDAVKGLAQGRKEKDLKPFEPHNFAGEKLDAVERRFTAGFTQANVSWQDKMLEEERRIAKAAEDQRAYLKKMAERKEEVASVGGP
jgi:hypothetical protein